LSSRPPSALLPLQSPAGSPVYTDANVKYLLTGAESRLILRSRARKNQSAASLARTRRFSVATLQIPGIRLWASAPGVDALRAPNPFPDRRKRGIANRWAGSAKEQRLHPRSSEPACRSRRTEESSASGDNERGHRKVDAIASRRTRPLVAQAHHRKGRRTGQRGVDQPCCRPGNT
jgi:hypothetical protein